MYLSRNHMVDSGGFGKYRGGLGMQRIILVRGSKNLTTNYSPYHGIPGGWGLFGGYPAGIGGDKIRIDPDDLAGKFSQSRYPVDLISAPEWGKVNAPDLPPLKRMPLPEGCIVVDPVMVGSGYGDPLERDPNLVLQDLFDHAVSRKLAQKIYGVALNAAGTQVNEAETQKLRKTIRSERLASAQPVSAGGVRGKLSSNARPVMRVHESLDVVADGGGFSVCCRKCSQDFGPATGNYKAAAVYRSVPKDEVTELPPPGHRRSMGAYLEYYCPGCATMLDVETVVPAVEGQAMEPVWDIQLAAESVHKASARADRAAAVAAE
jgi:N-methylhydantoinase B